MKDAVRRSVAKTVTWRVIAILSSLIVTSIFFGSFQQGVPVTIVLNASAMILYYIHERIWNATKWGKKK